MSKRKKDAVLPPDIEQALTRFGDVQFNYGAEDSPHSIEDVSWDDVQRAEAELRRAISTALEGRA